MKNLNKFIKTNLKKFLNEDFRDVNVNLRAIWYHGSDVYIDKFIKMPTVNRNGNVEGFYFTDKMSIAQRYGDTIMIVRLSCKKPFLIKKSKVTSQMVDTYISKVKEKADKENLSLNDEYLKEKGETFRENKRMPFSGLSGMAQQEIYRSGGYDCVFEAGELCVFDSDDIKVIGVV